MIISIDAENHLKNLTLILIKCFRKLRREGDFLNTLKDSFKKPISVIILNGEKPRGTRQGHRCHHHLLTLYSKSQPTQ